jgi:hypothetical protein
MFFQSKLNIFELVAFALKLSHHFAYILFLLPKLLLKKALVGLEDVHSLHFSAKIAVQRAEFTFLIILNNSFLLLYLLKLSSSIFQL